MTLFSKPAGGSSFAARELLPFGLGWAVATSEAALSYSKTTSQMGLK